MDFILQSVTWLSENTLQRALSIIGSIATAFAIFKFVFKPIWNKRQSSFRKFAELCFQLANSYSQRDWEKHFFVLSYYYEVFWKGKIMPGDYELDHLDRTAIFAKHYTEYIYGTDEFYDFLFSFGKFNEYCQKKKIKMICDKIEVIYRNLNKFERLYDSAFDKSKDRKCVSFLPPIFPPYKRLIPYKDRLEEIQNLKRMQKLATEKLDQQVRMNCRFKLMRVKSTKPRSQ